MRIDLWRPVVIVEISVFARVAYWQCCFSCGCCCLSCCCCCCACSFPVYEFSDIVHPFGQTLFLSHGLGWHFWGVALDDICIAGRSSTHGNPQFSAPCLSPPSGWVHRGRGLVTPANGTLKGTAKFMLGILTNRFTGPFTGPSFLGKKRFTGPLSGPSLQQVTNSHWLVPFLVPPLAANGS